MMSEFNINEDAQSGISQTSCNESASASETRPVESSAFPDEDEETVTMLDVIEREDKLEDEASAVLGFSDEKNCTYSKGYISRQALYSCATCSDGTDNQAAICLACSLECHENHEVIELYTKRNYRCDCGNSKFKPDFECKLLDKQIKKSPSNESNKYNHNFSGRYCSCDKRYPPDENDDGPEANDEMWQCIVCEDWYHTKHLGAKELPTKFDELICGQCANRLEFVRFYKDIDKKFPNQNACEGKIEPNDGIDGTARPDNQDKQMDPAKATTEADYSKATNTTGASKQKATNSIPCESDTNDSQAENKDPTTSKKSERIECLFENLRHEQAKLTAGQASVSSSNEPLFWESCSWRSKLCKCAKCLALYKEKECEFLIDDKDTVQYYEDQGRAMSKNRESPYERGMSALNRMNRAAVVEALHGYDELKADLSSYLRKFADTKKVVREEDIHDFFAQLKTKKRQRLEFE